MPRTFLRMAVALIVLSLIPTPADACLNCKYSPHGWGFCRGDFSWGATDCKEVVVDSFNGTTDCDFPLGYDCRQGGTRIGDGGGDGDGGGGGACWWTGIYGNCII